MNRVYSYLLMAFVAILPTIAQEAIAQGETPSNGRLAVEANGSTFLMDPDGRNDRRYRSGNKLEWSRDGRKIVYSEGTRLVWANVSADKAATPGPLQVIEQPADFVAVTTPSFSPNADRIAFKGKDGQLWVVNADGGNFVQLTFLSFSSNPALNEFRRIRDIEWKVFEDRIFFNAEWTRPDGVETNDIFSINPNGTNIVQITNSVDDLNEFIAPISLSRDGSTIYTGINFTVETGFPDLSKNGQVVAVSTSGGTPQPLFEIADSKGDGGAGINAIAISPDDQTLVFRKNRQLVSVPLGSISFTDISPALATHVDWRPSFPSVQNLIDFAPTSVVVGEEFEVTFTIRNGGNEDVFNATPPGSLAITSGSSGGQGIVSQVSGPTPVSQGVIEAGGLFQYLYTFRAEQPGTLRFVGGSSVQDQSGAPIFTDNATSEELIITVDEQLTANQLVLAQVVTARELVSAISRKIKGANREEQLELRSQIRALAPQIADLIRTQAAQLLTSGKNFNANKTARSIQRALRQMGSRKRKGFSKRKKTANRLLRNLERRL